MKIYIFLIAFLFSCASNSTTEKNVKLETPVLNSGFIAPVVIYLLDNESINKETIANAANQILKSFSKVESVPDIITKDGFVMNLLEKSDSQFIAPDTAAYSYALSDLSKKEIVALANAERLVEFTFFGTSDNVIQKQRFINDLVYSLAAGKKAVIIDYSTVEFYNSSQWKKNRIDNFEVKAIDIRGQVTIHTYREDDAFCRAVTLGMNKFCLPEISLKKFPCSDQNSFGNLVNATIQTLVEHPFITNDSMLIVDLQKIKNPIAKNALLSDIKTGASKKVQLTLKSVQPEEGDNYEPQLLISFEDPNYTSAQEEGSQVLATLFGAEDSVVYAQHDEALLEASARAKQKLPDLRKQFNKGLEPGFSILIKKAFKADGGGNEWMWVEVTKWDGQKMEGVLQNDPFNIHDLKIGAAIKFNESEVFDYILNKPDGSIEGNETGEIIDSQN